MFIQKNIQKIKNIIQKWLTEMMFKKYLSSPQPGGIAIDCGANIGDISLRLAKTGVHVYAFEPNPFAYEKLTEKLKGFNNVSCIRKGVWDRNTVTQLYSHDLAINDETFWSFGSSIIKDKGNIDKSRSVEVQIIDLTEFIEGLDRNIDLLKIDIEGAECELLEKFIEKELYKKVAITLVETHDGKITGQKQKTDKVRDLIRERGIKNIKLLWL